MIFNLIFVAVVLGVIGTFNAIFLAVTGTIGVLGVLAVRFFVIPAIDRAAELTPEEQEIVDLFAKMHAEDTGGLLALPRYDTTVEIAAVDRAAAVRTVTVNHEPTGTAGAARVGRHAMTAPVPGPGPESEPSGVTAPAPATTVARPVWRVFALRARIAALAALIAAVPAAPAEPAVEPDPDEWRHSTSWFTLEAIDADIAKAGAR